MSEWIKISDVVPAYKRNVLLADFRDPENPEYIIGLLGGCRNTFEWRVDDDAVYISKATHWMPLPKQ